MITQVMKSAEQYMYCSAKLLTCIHLHMELWTQQPSNLNYTLITYSITERRFIHVVFVVMAGSYSCEMIQ